MDHQKLSLRLAQLEKALHNTRTNKYSDKRKQNYHEKVLALVKGIRANDFTKFSALDLEFYREYIDIIFQWVEFLDNSTLNLIPFELVSCLQKVLEEWIDDHEEFTIVTSLTNKLDDYSFQYISDAKLDVYLSESRNKYEIDFSEKLIQINIPRYLVFDYLASVVLYHEVGHFIEKKYNIIERIFNEEPQLKALKDDPAVPAGTIQMHKNHFKEFFCDIFAAQYVGESSNHYLSYIGNNFLGDLTHPSTKDRLDVVQAFLSGKDDSIVSVLKNGTLNKTKLDLKIRYKPINSDDFLSLIPAEITDDLQLHSLFISGWNIWLDKECPLKKQFDSNQLYSIVNNLIEKSISNYLITKSWSKHHVPN